MSHSSDLSTRELVLMCLNNAVELRAPKLASGWKVVFLCLSEAAKDSNRQLVESGYAVLNGICDKHFVHVKENFFVELVSCFAVFAESRLTEICLQSIVRLFKLSFHLVASGNEGSSLPVRGQSAVFYTDSEEHIRLWWPLLFNLSSLVSHAHVDVRTAAIDTLFRLLLECGGSFSPQLWSIVFSGVLRPIFDNARQHTVLSSADTEWLSSTCLKAFQYLVSIYRAFFDRIGFLLPDYLELLCGCVMVDNNETLAEYGSSCFLSLVLDNKASWSAAQLTTICRALLHMLKTGSSVLLRPLPLSAAFDEAGAISSVSLEDRDMLKRLERGSVSEEAAPENVRELKVSVLTILVGVVSNLADGVFDLLSASDLKLLLDGLSYVHGAARKCALSNEKLRVKLEMVAVSRILELLAKQKPADLSRIAKVQMGVLKELSQLSNEGLRRASLLPLAKAVLFELSKWTKDNLNQHGDEMFEVLASLVQDNDLSIRGAASAVMLHFWKTK
jgi:hypothetical protein